MYDAIIIGAGMSGLAAGIRLAQYEKRVCILERHTTIGGLNSFYRLRGRNYDVGLHAVTNFAPRGPKKAPLPRVLRQLRLKWDDLALCPQRESAIMFPGATLRFSNDRRLLESEVARVFPRQIDRYRRLVAGLVDYDDLVEDIYHLSARRVLGQYLTDQKLVEMLLCPTMWYGCACENDMHWGQFCILFRSIFLEGFARPLRGVRPLLKILVKKFRGLGGELMLRRGVKRITLNGPRATGVELENGEMLAGRVVVSSAGWPETLRLAGTKTENEADFGQMSFVEAISVLDTPLADLGHQRTIVFFNDSPQMTWRKCDDLCDPRTGVICCPENFAYTGDTRRLDAARGMYRLTAIANFDRWKSLDPDAYQRAKNRWYNRLMESAVRFTPDVRGRVVDVDMFTPLTVERFTGKHNGAVYGSPTKRLDGRTPFENLYICGNDQGYVGVVGALMSGIQIANRYLLAP